jgi:hypothetical protein
MLPTAALRGLPCLPRATRCESASTGALPGRNQESARCAVLDWPATMKPSSGGRPCYQHDPGSVGHRAPPKAIPIARWVPPSGDSL